MYQKTSIAKLSENQIGKLLRGQAVRMKHGNHHVVHLSHEQHKKLARAHKKGAAATIAFDPYQIHQHRAHFKKGRGNWKDDVSHYAGHAVEEYLPEYLEKGEKFVKSKLGLGVRHHKKAGRPRKHPLGFGDGLKKRATRGRGRPRKHSHELEGEGWFDDFKNVAGKVGEAALPVATNLAGKYLEKKLIGDGVKRTRRGRGVMTMGGALNAAGYGIRKRTTRGRGRPRSRRGRGIGEDILKGVSTVAPFLPLLL
jgi:hypothetical protein